ncbi:hypothetical protein [Klebsiella quasipneumoniae]|uniref:hypothetical protein n=1 Tax=Klebsiella quasipneumoniae TaxID=1463165 RepID=UPI003D6D071A
MTDITKLAQREKFEAWWEREYKHLESSKYTDAVPHIKYGFWMAYQAGGAELVEAVEKAQGMETYWKTQCRGITDHCEELQARIAELESRTVKLPDDLHPDTQELVIDFCTAMAEKLYKAQLKYGYDADWKQDGWPSQCQAHFHQHIAKGDPRDVAAYCAFMWWHGWNTKPAEVLESRTVTVKLPDYRNTYKSPLADEVEHQVRLAIELFSSTTGIKVEAE